MIISSSWDKTIKIWDYNISENAIETLNGHINNVN